MPDPVMHFRVRLGYSCPSMLGAVPLGGRRRMPWFLTLALVIAVGCTSAPPKVVSSQPDPIAGQAGDITVLDPVSSHTEAVSGISLVSVFSKPVFVFGHPVAMAKVQPGSLRLADLVRPSKRLRVSPLPSPVGTAAVHVLEESREEDKWGALSTPAQRKVYTRFATDPSLGRFLVVVTDVRVVDGLDPVPVSAYRWPREAVEEYASCGIPRVGTGVPWTRIDDCTDAFFIASETVMVAPGSRVNGI
jgi:hypothetical protein